MDLVHLLSGLKKTSTLKVFLGFLLALSGANASADASRSRDFKSFIELRQFLLNEFGAAKQRIWLVTDFLSDGEIVSSLYVAKYRGLDVAVLLGRAKARAYMSRLRYLKRQSIPSALRPQGFPLTDPTLVLVDDQLYRIDGELNFLDQHRPFRAVRAEPSDAEAFQAAFIGARKNPEAAVPPPVPLVGKPRHNSNRFSKTSKAEPGAYNYDRHPQPAAASAGLPRQLPQQTVYQKRGRSGQDVEALAEEQRRRYRRAQRNILNPITAREPVIWSPRSPESF